MSKKMKLLMAFLAVVAVAALVIAALATEGRTTIHDIRHIQRGYENLPEILSQAGACITMKS